jgi:hypothetical protein
MEQPLPHGITPEQVGQAIDELVEELGDDWFCLTIDQLNELVAGKLADRTSKKIQTRRRRTRSSARKASSKPSTARR